jgi:putative ABC transport system permease protein
MFEEEQAKYVSYHLQRMTDIHLRSARDYGMGGNDLISQLWLLIGVACLVVGIGAANFANLMTARGMVRSREIGLRQVIGASRGQLIRQYLMESILVAVIAVIVAMVLARLVLPQVMDITGKRLEIDVSRPVVWLSLIGLALSVGAAAGAYPALYLSSLRASSCF